jgi:ketosteroid isomerase-like protein
MPTARLQTLATTPLLDQKQKLFYNHKKHRIMKSVLIISIISLLGIVSPSLTDEKQEVKQVIIEFSKAGDAQDAAKIQQLTSPNYRIVMNQLFGSKEINTMDRATYIQMIENKKFGGDVRTAIVNSIIISGNNAVADVTLNGKAMNVRSLFNLSKNQNGKWVLLSDTPTILP